MQILTTKKKLNTIHIIYFDIIKKGYTRYNTYIESKLVQESSWIEHNMQDWEILHTTEANRERFTSCNAKEW